MKILLIAYSFPPSQDPQSIRWYFISNELAKMGIELDILTVKNPLGRKNWNFHERIKIHEIFAGPIARSIMGLKSGFGIEDPHNYKIRKNLLFKSSKSIYKSFVNLLSKILPGDFRSEWFFFAIKYINTFLNLDDYAFIITSHEPGVDSLMGLYLKKKKNNIYWVADFGDPYVTPLYTSILKLWYEKRIEQRIYNNADLLIFTSKSTIDYLNSIYPPLINKKILLLEQGFSYNLSKSLKESSYKKRTFTLVYTGTLYKGFRDPTNFIKALLTVDFDFEFILAGRNEEFINSFQVFGSKFQYLGLLDYFETLKLQKIADVLVHISNSNSIQFPGKFYEYLGAQKPILSIVNSFDDPSVEIIKSLNCGFICKNTPEDIFNGLIKIKEYHSNQISIENFYEYSWEKKAKKLFDCLIEKENSSLKNE